MAGLTKSELRAQSCSYEHEQDNNKNIYMKKEIHCCECHDAKDKGLEIKIYSAAIIGIVAMVFGFCLGIIVSQGPIP